MNRERISLEITDVCDEDNKKNIKNEENKQRIMFNERNVPIQ